MNTEEHFGGAQEAKPSTPKRIPVASADGTYSARLNDPQPVGKRKRVRVSVSEDSISTGIRRLPNRFDREHYPRRDAQATLGKSYPRGERTGEERTRGREYDERYQSQVAEGNYGYNYNQANRNKVRPGGNSPKAKRDSKNAKGAGKVKKEKKPIPQFIPQEAPEVTLRYPEHIAPDTEIRLNKYLANAGVCSRREADILISNGDISVNGLVVTELGKRVTPLDVVECKGVRVESQSKVYVLLNKPKNCVTTSDDPECRLTVMDLVKNACPERIYPVGRLDRNTTGVLLITNDGDLAAKLTHPSFLKKKIYHVWLDKPVSMEHMQAIADGFELEDGEIHADALSYVTEDDFTQVGIEIHSGRNRIVRRIFEHFGYHVVKLDRVYFAGLTKKNLPRGRWRYLDEQEVNNLRMGAFE